MYIGQAGYSSMLNTIIMAVAAVAKDGIEKELTCPLCLDIFGEPKKLPCDHIYCKEPCLQGLLLHSFNGTITCPECRTVVPVPQNDLNNLPTAFRINRLKELYQKMQQKEETDFEPAEKIDEQATCTTHASQPLAIYCETCEELLCRDCLLRSDKHKDHDHGFIEEVAEKQREKVMKHVDAAKECQLSLLRAIEKVAQERTKVETHRKLDLNGLDSKFDAIINALTREMQQFRLSINNTAQKKNDALLRQEENLRKSLNELSVTIGQAENGVQTQSNHEITRTKRLYTEKLQLACAKTKSQYLQPVEHVYYGWHFSSFDEIVGCYKKGIYQYPLPNPQKCQLERYDSLEIGKQYTSALQVRDYAGKTCQSLEPKDIQVELHCIRDNKVIQGSVTLSAKGRHTISVTPQSRGRHKLNVKVNDAHISGSPFFVCVHIPPQQLGQPIHTITDSEVEYPAGLACYNGNLYVTNFSQVLVLNKNNKLIETHQLEGASEIAVDAETGSWYVTNGKYHQLHKFNKSNKHIKSVGGSEGSGPDQFYFPNGIQVSKSGEVFVCDTRNGRIKVYDKELCLQRIIGRQGSKKGSFDSPDNIAFDEIGNLFVTEEDNHRVQVLTPSGKTISTIGKKGCKPGELDHPVGIAISGRYMYVAEFSCNRRISVFTTKGEFVTTFGHKILHNPECIAIDRDGYVYVSNNRKQIFVF